MEDKLEMLQWLSKMSCEYDIYDKRPDILIETDKSGVVLIKIEDFFGEGKTLTRAFNDIVKDFYVYCKDEEIYDFALDIEVRTRVSYPEKK
jgi:hypothetical protein